MIMPETPVDTVCMYVVMVGFAITPLLETCFNVGESYSAHAAGSIFALVCWRLCTDAPLAASSTNRASRSGDVMHCWYVWHQNIWYIGSILSLRGIVSADKVSHLSVNDDVRVKNVPCEWCLIVPGWLADRDRQRQTETHGDRWSGPKATRGR